MPRWANLDSRACEGARLHQISSEAPSIGEACSRSREPEVDHGGVAAHRGNCRRERNRPGWQLGAVQADCQDLGLTGRGVERHRRARRDCRQGPREVHRREARRSVRVREVGQQVEPTGGRCRCRRVGALPVPKATEAHGGPSPLGAGHRGDRDQAELIGLSELDLRSDRLSPRGGAVTRGDGLTVPAEQELVEPAARRAHEADASRVDVGPRPKVAKID